MKTTKIEDIKNEWIKKSCLEVKAPWGSCFGKSVLVKFPIFPFTDDELKDLIAEFGKFKRIEFNTQTNTMYFFFLAPKDIKRQ